MFKQLQKRIIWTAVVLCFSSISPVSAQDEPKLAKKTTELQIEVTDEGDGSPLDNVQVRVKWGEGDSDSQKAVTNGAGIAKVKDIPRGSVTIRLLANGYKAAAREAELKTEKQTIKITLQKSAPPTEESPG
jgi:hypothetical protein